MLLLVDYDLSVMKKVFQFFINFTKNKQKGEHPRFLPFIITCCPRGVHLFAHYSIHLVTPPGVQPLIVVVFIE